ncbi:MAG: hypothetical protein JWQ73_2959, partial [Variovorax sp.]|nr:hypothetical protein [Variovorax sp.]
MRNAAATLVRRIVATDSAVATRGVRILKPQEIPMATAKKAAAKPTASQSSTKSPSPADML